MGKIKLNSTGGISGLVGPVVLVQTKRATVVRSKPDFSKTEWSENQKKQRNRFAAMNAFCARYKYSVIQPIWNLAPSESSGHNLFIRANYGAFDTDGAIADLSMLHFADGNLPLPFDFMAVKDETDSSLIHVSWKNDPGTDAAILTDELMMMVATEEGFEGPVATGIYRSALGGSINLPNTFGQAWAVYLFFGSKERERFSPDKYFGLE